MSSTDFKERISRLRKIPATGHARIVHKAMLQQEISEIRQRKNEEQARDDEDPNGWVSWLWVLLLLSFLVLAGLFVNDPTQAARVSIVMIPLMLFLIAAIFVHAALRHGPGSLFWDTLIHGDFIVKLLRMLR